MRRHDPQRQRQPEPADTADKIHHRGRPPGGAWRSPGRAILYREAPVRTTGEVSSPPIAAGHWTAANLGSAAGAEAPIRKVRFSSTFGIERADPASALTFGSWLSAGPKLLPAAGRAHGLRSRCRSQKSARRCSAGARSRKPSACNLRSPRMLTSTLSSASLPRGPSAHRLVPWEKPAPELIRAPEARCRRSLATRAPLGRRHVTVASC